MKSTSPSGQRCYWESSGDQLWTVYMTEATLFETSTPYQRAEIHVHPQFGKMLFLDGELQSASTDEFVYHEALVQPAMACHPAPRRVAILGGGEGGTAREILRHPCVEKVVMVDIDQAIISLSRQHLPEFSQGSFSDPRLEIVFADAKSWMERTTQMFDVIISDLTEPGKDGLSSQLFTPDFFHLLKTRLDEAGILAVQASNGNLGRLAEHCRIREHLDRAFRVTRSMLAHVPSFGCNWGFITASDVLDPGRMSAAEVEATLLNRNVLGLRYYDGETHQRLLSLPRYVRQALRGEPAAIS